MNQSVVKALKLLQYFTLENPKRSLAEISRLSGLSKPTAYRLLKSLESERFLSRNDHNSEDKQYQLGMRSFELGNIVAEGMEIKKTALPYMEHLRNEINQVVHLVILDGDEALYIEKVETNQPLKLFTRSGLRTPLFAGSAPRLLLAFMEEDQREAVLRSIEIIPFTDSTVTTIGELNVLLEHIKTNGYSISTGEYVNGTLGISVPVWNHSEKVIASLTVAIPGDYFSEEMKQSIISKMKFTAGQISGKLGYPKTVNMY